MKGFTLIELLVVVIIIGILAAIALPQYEIVVEKSRASEAMINTKAIRDAVDRHDQEFPGEAVSSNDQIADVQLKGGTWTSTSTFTTDNFTYSLSANTVTATRQGDLYTVTYTRDGNGNWFVDTSDCSDNYTQVCRLFAMTASEGSASSSSGNSTGISVHSGGTND